MYKHLLVPIDGSERSERAAAASLGLAAVLGARITAFVAEPLPPLPNETTSPGSYMRTAEQHRERTEVHAHDALARFSAQAAEQGVPSPANSAASVRSTSPSSKLPPPSVATSS